MMGRTRHRIISQKHTDILRALYHLNPAQRKALLQKADTQLIRYICECALNVLQGNIPLTKEHKSRLRKHTNILRKLANSTDNFSAKKKIIVQRGGFLPVLLAPLIGTILSNLISK
jgi:hypothetical protein